MNAWVWIDLELTGLDSEKDEIVEIAVIISDKSCGNLMYGPNLVINVPEDKINQMSEFVTKMHTKSGLIKEISDSDINLQTAENIVYEFLETQGITEGILAGNSVHMDRMFLLKHMPRIFEKHLSRYRLIDVSSIKELYKIWFNKPEPIKKTEKHRGLDDIKESIKELEYYLINMFNSP
jgi:oligoribonuclease